MFITGLVAGSLTVIISHSITEIKKKPDSLFVLQKFICAANKLFLYDGQIRLR